MVLIHPGVLGLRSMIVGDGVVQIFMAFFLYDFHERMLVLLMKTLWFPI